MSSCKNIDKKKWQGKGTMGSSEMESEALDWWSGMRAVEIVAKNGLLPQRKQILLPLLHDDNDFARFWIELELWLPRERFNFKLILKLWKGVDMIWVGNIWH